MIVIRGMEKSEDGFLKTMQVRTGDQLADGLTRRFILLLFEICWARWVLITSMNSHLEENIILYM